MEQIKFKAFNTHDKKWYGNEMSLCLLYQEAIGNPYDKEKWKIVRHSGLPDIFKMEACEGDIIKAWWGQDINSPDYGIGKVIFHCGCFMIEWIGDKEANMELLGMVYKTGRLRFFEVLNNIYENPELIHTYMNNKDPKEGQQEAEQNNAAAEQESNTGNDNQGSAGDDE